MAASVSRITLKPKPFSVSPDPSFDERTIAMPAPLRLIQSSPDLPEEADAVVIGGGIAGSFSAYYLAKRGLKVALVEKGVIGGEQSSRNWGWCRQQNRDARELPISTRSIELWERFGAESGEDTGFQRCGLFYVSNNEEELATWTRWGQFARTVGVETHMLSAQEATARARFTGQQWRGGVWSPTDGIANPGLAAPAVASALIRLGGSVHQVCAARGLETSGGAVSAVVTERARSARVWWFWRVGHGPPPSATSWACVSLRRRCVRRSWLWRRAICRCPMLSTTSRSRSRGGAKGATRWRSAGRRGSTPHPSSCAFTAISCPCS
jgi:hypothetical protein